MCIPSIIFHCWATAALLPVFQPKRGYDHMALRPFWGGHWFLSCLPGKRL